MLQKGQNQSKYGQGKKSNQIDPFAFIGTKTPPHSNEADVAVIGAMMLDKIAIAKALEILEPESFYNEVNKTIFQTMLGMFEKAIPVDILSLSEELNKRAMLDFVGGTYYLAEINSQTPTASNIEYYARIVQEKYLKRLLISSAGQILANCYDDSTDALEEIDIAESKIFEIAERRFSKGFVDLNKLSHEAFSLISNLYERDIPGMTGVPSGFRLLDEYLNGFQKGDLIIVAGRPSMGKTALALSMARNTAIEHKKPVGFFSLEMSAVQLAIRLISAETRIDQQKIRSGKISQKDIDKIIQTLGYLSKAPVFIDDSASLTLIELRAKCRRLKAEHKIEAVFVDYLQFLHPPKAESREREISIISKSLKQMAKELDIPVIALAQLNRSVEARQSKQPLLSDLRESGSIEQDADVVLFVHRPEFYKIKEYEDKSSTEGTAEIIIGKQRNGPTGTIRLAYLKDFARFENLAFINEEPVFANNNPPEDEDVPF